MSKTKSVEILTDGFIYVNSKTISTNVTRMNLIEEQFKWRLKKAKTKTDGKKFSFRNTQNQTHPLINFTDIIIKCLLPLFQLNCSGRR